MPAAWDEENTFSILISTDNHLGYNGKDVLRGEDSYQTFEEILSIAREREVDALLLGGDLFHENRPSRKTLHRTIELLRHYCLGDRLCRMELISDASVNFPTKFGTVNYEDPSYNVALPAFIIHGNHDDPAGDGNLSAIDILATAGLVNYFGKTNTVDDLTINPVMLKKGTSKVAMYGLGAVRDERLHRTFLQHKVKMVKPPEGTDDYFNLMILHQNRAAHGPTGYIPEHFLEEFLDLVVWGHEHECLACEPSNCPEKGFTVLQPGSSVATSLSEGETRGKHVVILQIKGKEMRLVPIPLRSVRPFLMRDVVLRDVRPRIGVNDTKSITQYLTDQVEEMISIARDEWEKKQSELPGEQQRPFPLPLIRLRVNYSAELDSEGFASTYAITNPQRFGQAFVNRIANPRDVVYFVRRRPPAVLGSSNRPRGHLAQDVPLAGRTEGVRVEDLVSQFLSTQRLDLFPQNEFCDIVRVAIEKDDRDAIQGFVKNAMERTVITLKGRQALTSTDKDSLKAEFERARRLREDEWQRLHPGIDALLAEHKPAAIIRSDDDNIMDVDEEAKPVTYMARGRGRGRGLAAASGTTSTTSRGRGRGRGVATRGAATSRPAASDLADDFDIDSLMESPAKRTRAVLTPKANSTRTPARNTLDFEPIIISSEGDANQGSAINSGIPAIPATPIVTSNTKVTDAAPVYKPPESQATSTFKWPPRRR